MSKLVLPDSWAGPLFLFSTVVLAASIKHYDTGYEIAVSAVSVALSDPEPSDFFAVKIEMDPRVSGVPRGRA